jgi:FkbM family methyltransferase
MSVARRYIRQWLWDRGYEVHRLRPGELDDTTRIVRLCRSRGLETLLDVGANRGQFAKTLRWAGFSGRIISFEPLSEAHAALEAEAEGDPKWAVAERMALGSRDDLLRINIAGNSVSSSFLAMGQRHVQAAPTSTYVGQEEVVVRRLDEVLAGLGVPEKERLALKLDTQGYEAEVLAGAAATLSRVKLIFTELSLVELYAGAPVLDEIYLRLRSAGFRCVALSHEVSDPLTGEMLQVNGTFVHDG